MKVILKVVIIITAITIYSFQVYLKCFALFHSTLAAKRRSFLLASSFVVSLLDLLLIKFKRAFVLYYSFGHTINRQYPLVFQMKLVYKKKVESDRKLKVESDGCIIHKFKCSLGYLWYHICDTFVKLCKTVLHSTEIELSILWLYTISIAVCVLENTLSI